MWMQLCWPVSSAWSMPLICFHLMACYKRSQAQAARVKQPEVCCSVMLTPHNALPGMHEAMRLDYLQAMSACRGTLPRISARGCTCCCGIMPPNTSPARTMGHL